MRHRLLAGLLLVFLTATAGCTAFGPGPVNEEQLSEEVTYQWNTDVNATIRIDRDRYKAIYQVRNQSEFEAYRPQRFNNQGPVDPIGLTFRYPNGTTVQVGSEAVSKGGSATTIDLPARNGSLAFAVQKEGKRVTIPQLVEGSYEVTLPPNTDVKYPVLAHVVPGGYDREKTGSLVQLTWENPGGDRLSVRYYLLRDLWLIGGMLAIASVLIVVGAVHYWLQIRVLRERREAIDVEAGSDDGQS